MPPVMKRFADLTAQPWANGRGETTEIVSFEESERADGTRWRLSVAELTRPGPFSPLPGVRRTIIPVGGAIVLSIDGEPRELGEGRPFAFDGGAGVELVALTGRCHAVNLMVDEASAHPVRFATGPAQGAIAAIALGDGDGYSCFDLVAGDADIPRAARVLPV